MHQLLCRSFYSCSPCMQSTHFSSREWCSAIQWSFEAHDCLSRNPDSNYWRNFQCHWGWQCRRTSRRAPRQYMWVSWAWHFAQYILHFTFTSSSLHSKCEFLWSAVWRVRPYPWFLPRPLGCIWNRLAVHRIPSTVYQCTPRPWLKLMPTPALTHPHSPIIDGSMIPGSFHILIWVLLTRTDFLLGISFEFNTRFPFYITRIFMVFASWLEPPRCLCKSPNSTVLQIHCNINITFVSVFFWFPFLFLVSFD